MPGRFFGTSAKVKTALKFLLPFMILSLLPGFSAACGERYLAVPPALPPAYYDCTEVEPQRLVDAYYAPYVDINGAQRQYAGKAFVFKNLEYTEAMKQDSRQGYIWAGTSVIKCYCVNIGDLARFRLGD